MVRVRRIEPGDGSRLAAVRLAALADSPDAFGSTLAAEAARTASEWAERAAAGSSGRSSMTVFAEGPMGAGVVGLAGGYRETDASTTIELVSMWVDPSARGTGIGRALVTAVVDWAREAGATDVALWVTQGNVAAERLYAASGFAATGETAPLPSNPSRTKARMKRSIT